mgnify:FL=1
MNELAERYRKHFKERNFHQRTIHCNSREFLAMAAFLEGQFSEDGILNYRQELAKRYQERSAHDKLRKAMTVFRWLVKQGLMIPVTVELRAPKPALIEVLTVQEAAAMLAQLDGPELVLLETLYGSGLRIGELKGLTKADVSFDPPQLRIGLAKGGSGRVVPLGNRLAGILRAYLDELQCSSLFDGLDANGVLSKAAKAAGVTKKITPHSCRHAFATHLLLNGASLIAVSKLLGHRNLHSTDRYNHLQQLDLAAEIRRCHPRGRRKS